MKFGKTGEEAKNDSRASSGGGKWMKYPKDGDMTFRLLQEPGDWVYFWEHFNPGGWSFPCTNETDCPGCNSDNEKMKKPARKVAFNVLEGDFVNVYKVPPLLADKLALRFERLGTITDREYTITRYKTGGDKVEYDVEGNLPKEIDLSKYDLLEIEPMLQESFDQAWNDKRPEHKQLNSSKIAESPKAQPKAETPPWEEKKDAATEVEYNESDLRSMSLLKLVGLMGKEGIDPAQCPKEDPSVDDLVDWMLTLQS